MPFEDLDGTVDVVVSNPPYIPMTAYESVAPEARDHDPDLALWSGEDGLDAVRVVERVAARLLRSGGVVGVEHAEVQADAVPQVLRRHRPMDRRGRPSRPDPASPVHHGTPGRLAAVSTRYDTSVEAEREEGIAAAAKAVQDGRLVMLPTDTVYGVGADAFNAQAVQLLLSAKGRGRQVPPPVLVSAKTTLEALASAVPDWAHGLVEEFWPGPLTLVLPPAAVPAVGPRRDPGHGRGAHARPRRRARPARSHRTPRGEQRQPHRPAGRDRRRRRRRDARRARSRASSTPAPTPGPMPSTILDCTGDQPRVLRDGRPRRGPAGPGAVSLRHRDRRGPSRGRG